MKYSELEKKQMREFMRKRNATPEGAAYNRRKIKIWRRKTKSSHSRYRKTRVGEWREAITYFLIDRDGPLCWYCKRPIDLNNYNLAHKVALALGGKSRIENYVLSCPECNHVDGIRVHKLVICK